jgi:hypothetical protein
LIGEAPSAAHIFSTVDLAVLHLLTEFRTLVDQSRLSSSQT